MTEIEYNIATIKAGVQYMLDEIRKQKNEAAERAESEPIPEFVTLELAAQLKGGAAYNTYKTRYYLQPCGGTNSKRVGGRKCWRREDVESWLRVDDEQLPDYLKQFGISIKKS